MSVRLPILAGGAPELPERLQTMRQAIAWSYDLLPPAQQDLFRWLSVFVGGCRIDAIEHVMTHLTCEPPATVIDGIAGLADASLIQRSVEFGCETRFTMLETIREFGVERLLAEGDDARARDAHAAWCIAFAEEAGSQLAGPDHVAWWNRIEIELGNIRGAHGWLLQQGDTERAFKLGVALSWFWSAATTLREGRAFYRQLIEMSESEQWPELLDGVLGAAGNLEHWLDNFSEAEALFTRRLALCRARDDTPCVVTTLRSLASVAVDRNQFDLASQLLEEGLALATTPSSAWVAAAIASLQGIVAFGRGDYEQAAERSIAAVQGWDAVDDIGHVAVARVNQSRAVLAMGDARQAADILWRVFEVIQPEVGDDLITCDGLELAAGIALASREHQVSAQLLAATDAMLTRLGLSQRTSFREFGDRLVAQVRGHLGETDFAAAWYAGASLSISDALDIARVVVTAARLAQPSANPLGDRFASLTDREREVLRLVAQGNSDKEIAALLGIARFTASNHVSNIRTKLNAPSRAAVAAIAARAGYG